MKEIKKESLKIFAKSNLKNLILISFIRIFINFLLFFCKDSHVLFVQISLIKPSLLRPLYENNVLQKVTGTVYKNSTAIFCGAVPSRHNIWTQLHIYVVYPRMCSAATGNWVVSVFSATCRKRPAFSGTFPAQRRGKQM